MIDIHGNPIEEGQSVYILTTPRSGSKYKRLFYGVAVDVPVNKETGKFRCYENQRVVSVTSSSIIVPME
jgi:hypothetical protein